MRKTIYSKDQKFLVERLKKARIDAGFDQNEIAKLLGMSQSYVSKMESGQRKIDIFQLKNLAKIYKKSLDYFLQ